MRVSWGNRGEVVERTELYRQHKEEDGKPSVLASVLVVVKEEITVLSSVVVADVCPSDVGPCQQEESNNVPGDSFWVIGDGLQRVSESMQHDSR